MYCKEYASYSACEDACILWSKNHPGQYYVSNIEGNYYTISSLSEYDGEPYWQNGLLVYPDSDLF